MGSYDPWNQNMGEEEKEPKKEKISLLTAWEQKLEREEEKEKQDSYRFAKRAKICYCASLFPLAMGFFKMYVYENGEYSWETPINAYVGGDAYNLIINATYAAAWFLLVVALVVIGTGFLVCRELARNREAEAEKKKEIFMERNMEEKTEKSV